MLGAVSNSSSAHMVLTKIGVIKSPVSVRVFERPIENYSAINLIRRVEFILRDCPSDRQEISLTWRQNSSNSVTRFDHSFPLRLDERFLRFDLYNALLAQCVMPIATSAPLFRACYQSALPRQLARTGVADSETTAVAVPAIVHYHRHPRSKQGRWTLLLQCY